VSIRRRATVAALALVAAAPLPASEQAPTGPVAFAVPSEGPVTLGVFDASGQRVRTLHALDSPDSFQRGLNGLVTSWDGLDDEGAPVPAGDWFIRGFLLDGVMVAEQPTPLDEWSADPKAPRPQRILDFLQTPDNAAILLFHDPAGKSFAARWSPDDGFAWCVALDGEPSLLAAAGQVIAAAGPSTWHLLDASTGRTTARHPNPIGRMPEALAGFDGSLFALAAGELSELSLPSLGITSTARLPVDLRVLAASPDLKAAASPDQFLVSTPPGDAWRALDIPVSVDSLAIGEDSTVWFSGRAMDPDSSPLVGQCTLDGEIARAMFAAPDDPVVKRIRANPQTASFGTLAEDGGGQVLRLLRRDSPGAWLIEWEKTTPAVPPARFEDGSHRFRLASNELVDGQREGWIHLRTMATPDGTFLVTDDDLPLVHVTTTPNADRVSVARGPVAGSLLVAEGGGTRHLVTGLDRIVPLVVGGVGEPDQEPANAPSAGRQNQPSVSTPVARP
jgi:hypothetical protein